MQEAVRSSEIAESGCGKLHEGPLRVAQIGPTRSPPADPEQALVLALAQAVVACRAVGQDYAVRAAWRALCALLAQPAPNSRKVTSLADRDNQANGGEPGEK